jgi:hypothetical protein
MEIIGLDLRKAGRVGLMNQIGASVVHAAF